jgi:hypothetical protein
LESDPKDLKLQLKKLCGGLYLGGVAGRIGGGCEADALFVSRHAFLKASLNQIAAH